MHAPTDHIDLKRSVTSNDDGSETHEITYSFKNGDDHYKVIFEDIKFGDKNSAIKRDIENLGLNFEEVTEELNGYVYEVYLVKENSIRSRFQTTNTKGGAAQAVYSEMLLAIKKLVKEHNAKVLTFSPFEPAMGLIYTRFAKTYMTDWTMVSSNIYMRNDIVSELSNSRMTDKIKANQQSHELKLGQDRRERQMIKKFIRTHNDWSGKLLAFTDKFAKNRKIGVAIEIRQMSKKMAVDLPEGGTALADVLHVVPATTEELAEIRNRHPKWRNLELATFPE